MTHAELVELLVRRKSWKSLHPTPLDEASSRTSRATFSMMKVVIPRDFFSTKRYIVRRQRRPTTRKHLPGAVLA